ncbi:MAG: pitrilysin family protein [Myxococcota bacterium]
MSGQSTKREARRAVSAAPTLRLPTRHRLAALAALAGALACSSMPAAQTLPAEEGPHEATATPPATREAPPASGPARDIAFPPIARSELANGLELNVVRWEQLPVVYLRLVIESGAAADPANLQGLSSLVADMLKEGTRRQTSAELAERIEFLGADLSTGADQETVSLVFRALSEHLDEAMDILAEVATQPAFASAELAKLKRREEDRLALLAKQPFFLARRALYAGLYGDHPYGRIETTPATVERVRRTDLQRWHRTYFVPANAHLVAVGAVTPEAVESAAERAFGRWRGRAPAGRERGAPPERSTRTITVVDRPGSVQSVIVIGNLAIERGDEDYVPLMVANQVLGGSAASRLFMDLRERRSLTYGAYSVVGERVDVGPFLAYAQVRTEVTAEAMRAFFENLDAITRETASDEELANAHRYLSDSFPLQIDTPGKIANLVSELRVFGLSDDYWDGFRTQIRQVSAPEALAAARAHMRPNEALVVVVGEAAQIAESLTAYGRVAIVDGEGNVTLELAAANDIVNEATD